MEKKVLLCWFLFLLFCTSSSGEPVTVALGIAGASFIAGAALKAKCFFRECCTERWTNFNSSELHKALDAALFGQHLVKKVVSKAVYNHLKTEQPKKALALSFHGWTGSGKNFVADIIAKHVLKEGTKSRYYHKKIATHDYPHGGNAKEYEDELVNFIVTNTDKCGRSIFIFDEMDKMPSGLTNRLKPFLDFHENIKNIDYRKNIFIFLSNTGGDKINKVTFNHFKAGKSREDISSKEMEQILSVHAFRAGGGEKDSALILHGLVDFYIPFLPLERKHVKECASVSISKLGKEPSPEILEEIANELQYFPPGEDIYSKTGCKQVEKKAEGFV